MPQIAKSGHGPPLMRSQRGAKRGSFQPMPRVERPGRGAENTAVGVHRQAELLGVASTKRIYISVTKTKMGKHVTGCSDSEACAVVYYGNTQHSKKAGKDVLRGLWIPLAVLWPVLVALLGQFDPAWGEPSNSSLRARGSLTRFGSSPTNRR